MLMIMCASIFRPEAHVNDLRLMLMIMCASIEKYLGSETHVNDYVCFNREIFVGPEAHVNDYVYFNREDLRLMLMIMINREILGPRL